MRHSLTILLILTFGVLPPGSANAELPKMLGSIHCDTVKTIFGRKIEPLGDQNNDGYDDFMTWDYRFRAYLFYGGEDVDSVPALVIDSVNFMHNIGDVTGDGVVDFTLQGRSPVGRKLGLYYGGEMLDTIRDAWFGLDEDPASGNVVYGDDINSNGTNELFTQFYISSAGVQMFELEDNLDSLPDLVLTPANLTFFTDYTAFGTGLAAGDFNGDGKRDLAVHLRTHYDTQINGAVYLYWGGASFDTIPDLIINRPGAYVEGGRNFGQILKCLGDFNGDGYDDFFAGSGVSYDDTINFVYFGGPTIDTIPDLILSERQTRANLAGDINNDGHNDLITAYPTPFREGGDVFIYLGGPDVDSIPDIHFDNSYTPEYSWGFGEDCVGIGDYNGDGIDDFAFSARETGLDIGTIYIYAGWDSSATDVTYEYEPTMPESFALHQNYPNPFNPSTTIEFNLPERGEAELTIYNILGREIRTLINRELPPGAHTATWNGRTNTGERAPSGVYLYRISTEGFEQARKMVFLK